MALDLSFKDLADVAAGSTTDGRPLMVALDLIDEDPDQPRREFSEEDLQSLAASIRVEGILQPIVVRRSQQPGRFVIMMGARRYRAVKLAELAEAPVIVQDADVANPYAQMIENIQRDDLKASEIARFITARLEAGEKQTEIARRLGKARDWVSRYGAVPKMPPFLQEMLASSSIRAVYELYQAWRQDPAVVERAVISRHGFTDAEARAFASTVRSPGNVPADGASSGSKRSNAIPALTLESGRGTGPKPRTPSASQSAAGPAHTASMIVRVRSGKRRGSLVLNGAATTDEGFALVAFEDGATEAVAVGALRIEAVSIH
ncbi:ParB/RepB/Spo0J family partition protein [Bosea sp. (in: a-proteobacteria)]|jgi:ParB family chromosome partitioning protein|uniref:ParB/RepB/Spo0J family partition protein n=1 Tax=Bosea sp. (in: a-proteobacteria) TaxID=1871050 RepID=UPI0035613AB9